ncbi:MAG: transposase [Sandaracinus sp.]|nr:transposase [Sandaracinus sp.]MCB9612275.1 transposase [Sandaracinus sp.]
MLVVLGVDTEGNKHVLGLWEGATENGAACSALLLLFAPTEHACSSDGSKAHRSAIRATCGNRALVQRCQVHEVRNVLGHVPKERHAHARKRCAGRTSKSRSLRTPRSCSKTSRRASRRNIPGWRHRCAKDSTRRSP